MTIEDRLLKLEVELKETRDYLIILSDAIRHNHNELYTDLSKLNGKDYPEV